MNLADLQREAHAIAKDHGWWDEPRTFGDLIALVHRELSEALEAYREWGLKSVISATAPNDHTYRYFDINLSQAKVPDDWTTKPDGVASELADVVIRVADMAEWYGVENLQEWIDSLRESDLSGITTFGEWITCCHLLASKAMEQLHEDANDPEHGIKMAFGRLGSLVMLIQRMAAHYGIDLDAAIAAKMEYNRGRAYRHRGKAL